MFELTNNLHDTKRKNYRQKLVFILCRTLGESDSE